MIENKSRELIYYVVMATDYSDLILCKQNFKDYPGQIQ